MRAHQTVFVLMFLAVAGIGVVVAQHVEQRNGGQEEGSGSSVEQLSLTIELGVQPGNVLVYRVDHNFVTQTLIDRGEQQGTRRARMSQEAWAEIARILDALPKDEVLRRGLDNIYYRLEVQRTGAPPFSCLAAGDAMQSSACGRAAHAIVQLLDRVLDANR